ncbi:MAG: hypothetical protein HYR88_18110 [Verrucomicrobia bacterium]|nr:hypothetical protein [Verrucomicrobiota bacterium]MBI3869939.1 hypothetical protein [Verrucomicrobiota bacterium]
MSFRPIHFWLTCAFLIAGSLTSVAESYKLLDGQAVEGPPMNATKEGIAFRDSSGSQGPRIHFTNFTQQALLELAKHPKVKRPLIEQYLEIVVEEPTNKVGRPKVELRPFDHLQRPDPKGGLSQISTSSIGLFFLFLLFVGNLYSAYEVGVFRNYSPYLVMGIAFVAPLLTQVIFLCLPTYVPKSAGEEIDATAAHVPTFAAAGGGPSSGPAGGAAGAGGGAAGGGTAPAVLPHFKRGEYTFNKRFFETKMSGFFGIRPTEAEKGFQFQVKCNRGQLVCNRVVRVTPAEVTLQVLRGATIEEMSVPFTEILDIQIKQNS